jgi:valyl-tRNA synthetase
METGYDIIFFWVARMMMMGLTLTEREPFHTVYLSGLIRDPEGQKMSKTKGNVVDPLGVIDESGADALRFALIHGAAPGIDQRFGPAKLENARNFANKLWNAARFVIGARPSSIAAGGERQLPDDRFGGPAERWLLSRAASTTAAVNDALRDHAFAEVTRVLYDAIWSEYCDWGLEFAKVRLADETLPAEAREATWWTLVEVLDTYLRLLHPVMPFITEAIWSSLPHRASDPPLLIVARWPGAGERDVAAEAQLEALIDLVRGIRNARSEARLEPATWLPVDVAIPPALGTAFESLAPAIERLARARPLHRRVTAEDLRPSTDGGSDLFVVSGDLQAIVRASVGTASDDTGRREAARIERELAEAETRLAGVRLRLADEAFTAKAPPAIVDGARRQEADLSDQVDRLRERLGS